VNRKFNTLLFILAATLFNIMATLVFFTLLFLAFAFLVAPRLGEAVRLWWALPVIFLASITFSFFLYHAVVKRFAQRVNMDTYFSPVFLPPRRAGKER
jgi:hypothetical protein